MAIHFTFCKPKIEDVRWRLPFVYYGDDSQIENLLERFFSQAESDESLDSQVAKLKTFERMFQVKLNTDDPNWYHKAKQYKISQVGFYAHDLEIDLIGETKDQREFSLGFSALNFHRFFNDYLDLNISESGRENPEFFLNAIKQAPPPFFGTTAENDDNTITEPETGFQFSSTMFSIGEDYIASRKLKLEEICLEAIKRQDMICWRGN